ncbi:MAG TPA: ABC transporter ATP-binding protein [Longimicrobiaceae bacterium]|nr:ABC transporter ATP-binding protein [Longimicrobiaceae bacterium]
MRNLRELIVSTLRLRPYLRGSRSLTVAVVVSLTAAAALEGVGIGLLVPLLGLMLGSEDPTSRRILEMLRDWFPGHGEQFYVAVLCLSIVGAIALKNVVLYGSNVLAARLRRRVTVRVRDDLFARLHGAPLQVFEERPAGELASVFLTETLRLRQFMEGLLLLGQKLSLGLFYVVALLVLSWPLMLATLVIGAVIGGTIAFVYRHLVHSGQQITELNQRIGSNLVESFAGVRVIRVTDSQAAAAGSFHDLNAAQAAVEEETMRSSSLLGPITETVAVAGAIVMVGGAYFFLVRPGLMAQNVLFTFGFVLLRLLPLVNQLYTVQGFVLHMLGSVREVDRWMSVPQYPRRPFGEAVCTGVRDVVRLSGVGYVYPNGTRALENVTLEIPVGKTVAIVGASGSGKSTIASLLLRLRQPTEGTITVDGRDYWEFSPDTWHRNVALVEQEAFLFHDTMLRNITFGLPGASPEAVREAVRMAYLDDVVQALPAGLNSVVGERGANLSGGQRQRLAIARALVRDPRILVLDEATSALDTVSERQVQAALENARQGRTAVVIAHRLSTVRTADHIVVLAEGRVVEQGTWEELSSRSGTFSSLLSAAVSAA